MIDIFREFDFEYHDRRIDDYC